MLAYSVTRYDDGRSERLEFDRESKHRWKTVETFRATDGSLDRKVVRNDDGTADFYDRDELNEFPVKQIHHNVGVIGQIGTTTITGDDGTVTDIDWGMAGNLLGTHGADSLTSGRAVELLLGGAGDDEYHVSSPTQFVNELSGEGRDTVFTNVSYVLPDHVERGVLEGSAGRLKGNALANSLLGNDAANVIHAGRGNDRIYGGAGDDTMEGGSGRDTLTGGLARDILAGSEGADSYAWRSVAETGLTVATADRVLHFSPAEDDRLDIRLIDADETRAGNQAFVLQPGSFTAPGQVRVIYVDADMSTRVLLNTDSDRAAEGMIWLAGKVDLTGSDFFL